MKPESIRKGLRTRLVGRRVLCVETCASTNDLAWRGALDGAEEGTVWFAEEQTAGRGRWGRRWEAARGTALLCSILLRPGIEAERAPLVTVAGAFAVTDTAEALGVPARVRFPNDVFVGEKKLAGVLAESRFVASRPDWFVLGIGLNVTGSPSGFPATSLADETGEKIGRLIVARILLRAVDDWVGRLSGPLERFRAEWRRRSNLVGRAVRISQNGVSVAGTVTDVDCLEGVEVRLSNGHLRVFRSEHIERIEVV